MNAKIDPLEGVDLDNSHNKAILIVTSVFFGISLVSVMLRCFVRTQVVRAWGWDDGTMVIAMSLNTAFAMCGIVGCKYGLGMELSYFILHPDNLHRAMLCWWVGQLFYVLTCVVAKLSIIIALLRITISRVHAYILYAAMALATIIGLLFFFLTVFQCTPVNYFWNRAQPHAHGSCIDNTALTGIAYLYSVGAAITDLTIGLLPVALIWNLHMNCRNKAAIVAILGIGCMFVTPKHFPLIYLVANANIPAVRVLRLLFASPTSKLIEIQTSYVRTTHSFSPSQSPPPMR
ncbi:unnamed protein product [Penicillium discolor]